MSLEVQRQVEFTRTFVVPRILESNDDLRELKLVKTEAKSNDHLNGFMSNIINLTLTFEDANGE